MSPDTQTSQSKGCAIVDSIPLSFKSFANLSADSKLAKGPILFRTNTFGFNNCCARQPILISLAFLMTPLASFRIKFLPTLTSLKDGDLSSLMISFPKYGLIPTSRTFFSELIKGVSGGD